MSDDLRGLIIKGIGGLYTVMTEGGLHSCRVRGIFRLGDIKPMVGDHVRFCVPERGDAVITEILPRRNSLIRPAVANIDTLVAIVSAAPPVTPTLLIDKVSAVARFKDIEFIVCINKCDIDRAEGLFDIYTRAGFRVLRASAETGEGIDEVIGALSSGVCVLTGNSGVGKSSIIRHIDPAWTVKVGDLSEKIGRGRQTTRHVELYKLPSGAFIADTPGFSSFDIERMDLVLKDDLQYTFPEFEEYIPQCEYTGCSHVKERGCAVITAVGSGDICPSRYESYTVLYESMRDYRDWEHKRTDE